MTEDINRYSTPGQGAAVTPPPPAGPPVPPPGAPAPVAPRPVDTGQPGSGDSSDTKEAAKQEASELAGTAKEQASQVAGTAKEDAAQVAQTAKEEARATAAEAKRQAQEVWRQSQAELSEQAGTQQQRLAGGLQAFASEMGQMADGAEEPGIGAQVAHWASGMAGDAGRWLEDRDPESVLGEVKRYARRSPGTFMLIAAGLGLAAGRIARSLKDAGDDNDQPAGVPTAGGTAGTTAPGGYPPPSTGTTTGYPATTGTAGTTGYPTAPPPPSYPPAAPGGGL